MANIYVSPTGNDTTGDGSIGNPYLTIQKGVDEYSAVFPSSDAVLVKTGTYSAGALVTDRYVVISAYDGNVTINGTGGTCFEIVRTTNGSDNNFQIIPNGYSWAVSGFDYALKENSTFRTDVNDYTSIESIDLSNQKIKISQNSVLFSLCNLSGCDFEYYDDYLLSEIALIQVSDSNCDDTTGMCLFSTVGTVGASPLLNSNTFNNAEIIINDISGIGYSELYLTAGATIGNTLDGAKVKFSDTDVTLSALALIPFATVYTLPQMQAKANLDMGAGHTMHSDSFIFSIVPVPPEDQPNPAARRFPANGGLCFVETRPRASRTNLLGGWDSKRITLSDGLIQTAYNSVFAENDLVQNTAANQPQYGYDHVALYDVETLADGLTTSFANTAAATTRNLATLTEAGATAPTKAGSYLEFALDKRLTLLTVARTLSTITLESFGKATGFSGSVVNGTEIRLHNQSTSSANRGVYLSVVKIAADEYRIRFFVGNGTASVTLSSSAYTEAQIIALLANDTHITGRFLAGSFHILVNGVIVASTTSATVLTCSIQSVSDFYIRNQMTGTTLYMKYSRTYYSALTDIEISQLYTNKTNPSYTLQKFGIVSDGASSMSALFIQNTLMTSFTVGCWVYLQDIIKPSAIVADQFFLSHETLAVSTDKGFQLKIQKNPSDQFHFRFVVANGVNSYTSNSTILSRSAFVSNYLNRWTFVAATLKNQGATDLLNIYVDGILAGSTSVAAGSFYTSVDGIIRMMQRSSTTNNILASNKMESAFIYKRALGASEIKSLYNEHRNKFRYLNNL